VPFPPVEDAIAAPSYVVGIRYGPPRLPRHISFDYHHHAIISYFARAIDEDATPTFCFTPDAMPDVYRHIIACATPHQDWLLSPLSPPRLFRHAYADAMPSTLRCLHYVDEYAAFHHAIAPWYKRLAADYAIITRMITTPTLAYADYGYYHADVAAREHAWLTSPHYHCHVAASIMMSSLSFVRSPPRHTLR